MLRGLDHGICGCKAIRSFRSHGCLHCSPPVPPPRPAMASDKVTVPQVRSARQGGPQQQQRRPAVLTTDWTKRVRALPGHTLPHVPACVREATAIAMTQGLEALLADEDDRDLEQGRAKLLLAPPRKDTTSAPSLRSGTSSGRTAPGRRSWCVLKHRHCSASGTVAAVWRMRIAEVVAPGSWRAHKRTARAPRHSRARWLP